MSQDFQMQGTNAAAPFSLKVHRGDGMVLLAMNWRQGKPPRDFVGFAIEYKEPNETTYYALRNRLCFPGTAKLPDNAHLSTLLSPIQKFRWIHFPRNANLPGDFTYRVKPVFSDAHDNLTYGEAQEVKVELRRETYPGQLNVAYTRGFVSSQAFVDRYESKGPISKLLPSKPEKGLTFKPSHPLAKDALKWMGFEAREEILSVLDQAIADVNADVCVVAYDLNEPEIVLRLEQLGLRLRVIIDNSASHGKSGSAENQAAKRLAKSAGKQNVKRQHMGQLQHCKTITVTSPNLNLAVCGSTNFSWRGLYVQANNAVVVQGKSAVQPFIDAFESYWANDTPADFGGTPPAEWTNLGLAGIDAQVAFSPHKTSNALLKKIADDIAKNVSSNLLYSLAFLYQTPGAIKNAITKVTKDKTRFVYGISDRKVGGLDVQKPDGNRATVYPAALSGNVPSPFKEEPIGGGGVRMHHKFVIIDFDKPSARVYLGSYNFSTTADTKNGENLLLIRDRRVAVSYTVEALSLFDHYHFRLLQQQAKKGKKTLELARPPQTATGKPWWDEDYTDVHKVRDRELFA